MAAQRGELGVRTTARGTVSELRVKARLVELGAQFLEPVGHDFPFDAVAYHRGAFSRVQIKTAREGRLHGRPNGSIAVSGCSVGQDGRSRVLTPDLCDVILAWHEERQVAYALPPARSRFFLRTRGDIKPGTADWGYARAIRVAEDYELRSLDQVFPHRAEGMAALEAALAAGMAALALTPGAGARRRSEPV